MNNNILVLNNYPITADQKSQSFLRTWLDDSLVPNLKKYYVNGHSKYLHKVSLSVVKDLRECKRLWNMFSRPNRLYDLWDFRYAFHKAFKYDPHFIVLKTDDEIVGLLPLDYNKKRNVYWWFGGDWPEDNRFFTKDPIYAPLLLFFAPKNLELFSIREIPESLNVFKDHIINCDPQFKLDLPKGFTIKNYLENLRKKKRYNLKRDVQKIEKYNPKIVINNKKDYKNIWKMVSQRFHSKGEVSDWESDPAVIDAFNSFVNKNSDYKIRFFSIYIDGKCVASDINTLYNGVYYTLRGAYDVMEYPGIGNYIFYKEIEDAIGLGMKEINFLQTDYGWKHKWFTTIPTFRYTTI